MNSMKYKAVMFDLDDTLTESKQQVSEVMVPHFTKLLSVVPVAIVSGAKFEQQLHQFIEHLPKDAKFENLYSFPQNATKCLLFDGTSWVEQYSFSLSDDEATKIINALNKVLEETKIVEGEPSFGERIENRGAQVTFSALGQEAPIDLKRVWDKDGAKRKGLKVLLDELLPEFEIVIGGGTSIDITKKGLNKTYAVKWLSEKLSLPISEMVYVGDSLFPGGNDSVVIQTGVPVIPTKNPEETVEIIDSLIL